MAKWISCHFRSQSLHYLILYFTKDLGNSGFFNQMILAHCSITILQRFVTFSDIYLKFEVEK